MRIMCDPVKGLNKYGCAPTPDPLVLSYGSSSASTISSEGFVAAEQLRKRLSQAESPSETYAQELTRIRRELFSLCELDSSSGLEIIFAASGTDIHLFVAQLVALSNTSSLLIIMVEPSETGIGVPAALRGCHFSERAAMGVSVTSNTALEGGSESEIVVVQSRTDDGNPRSPAIVDAEVENLAANAVKAGKCVLLILIDVSKTGLIGPSPACALALRRRFHQKVEVLVDACQFRLAPSTLRSYLDLGLLVAITGSKFVTGPAFCGALLMPKESGRRLQRCLPPASLRAYSAKADWPEGWAARSMLNDVANYGLLLRWEAALNELRAFRSLPEREIATFLESFATAVSHRISNNPVFEPLPVLELDRRPASNSKTWDSLPTIFPFLLKHSGSNRAGIFSRDEMIKVCEQLRSDLSNHFKVPVVGWSELIARLRCQVGQPVSCGTRYGVPASALRLCMSSRLIVDALSPRGRGVQVVIDEALTVLDKVAQLVTCPEPIQNPR